MKKKLWDIPRLKIGAPKKDDGADSPPATPKSVVPPLSPRVDYELRTACALVLQNFKPSDYVYHERFGDDGDEEGLDYKTQLNYAAFMQALDDDEPETALDPVNTRVQPDQPDIRQDVVENPVQELSRRGSKTLSGQTFKGKLWDRVREEHGVEVEEPKPKPPPTPTPPPQPRAVPGRRNVIHKRSFSQPLPNAKSMSRENILERPKTAGPRSDSMRTTGSTPQTDGTEYGWNASTAPSTAPITPAARSKRTSEQAWQSLPAAEIPTVDADWMRQELERHRQEEAKAQRELEEQVRASLGGTPEPEDGGNVDNAPHGREVGSETFPAVSAPTVRVPTRKPVPKGNAATLPIDTPHQQNGSRPGAEIRRSTSRRRRSTPRSESNAELEMLRPDSRQGKEAPESAPVAADELTEEVVVETRPSRWRRTGTRAPAPSGNPSEAPSRSRSITRQVAEFIRAPGSRMASRKQSFEISRPGSRSRSMDSVRSAVSAISSTDYSANKWNSWRPFRRTRDSTELTRQDSANSRSKDMSSKPATKGKTKPPINLNRELPPLPSLDQWKDEAEEPEPPVPPKPANVADLSNANPGTSPGSGNLADPQSRQQKPWIDSTTSLQLRDSVLNENSAQARSHPKRMSSLGAPTNPSKYPIPGAALNTVSLPNSPGIAPDSTTEQFRSMSSTESPLQGLTDSTPNSSTVQTPAKITATAGSRHISNFSTSAVGRINSQPDKRTSSFSPFSSSAAKSMSMDQSRSVSDMQPNFSRKISSDDHNRGLFGRSQESNEPRPPAVPPKDKPKKKWWQSSRTQKRAMSWVDSAMKSSPRSAV